MWRKDFEKRVGSNKELKKERETVKEIGKGTSRDRRARGVQNVRESERGRKGKKVE